MWFVIRKDTLVDPYAMTLAVVHEKKRHAMTLVDPCVVCEKSRHAMTLVVVPERNTHAITLVDRCVVSEKNRHAITLGGSICGL